MTMNATVQTVENGQLLVCDMETNQDVVVHTSCAYRFCPGDRVCIEFNGAMTMSIPPQISATCIKRMPSRGCC